MALGEGLDAIAKVFGGVVDGFVGAVLFADGELVVAGGAGDDAGAEGFADFDGGEADAAGGAEDEEGLAGLEGGAVAQGVVGGAVGQEEGGAGGEVHLTLTATATDTDGTVTKVDFFDGATLVGTATSAPYSVALTNVALGAHSYTAAATDNFGIVTTSTAINVIVNALPSASISSPASGATFIAPATIPLTATAADTDGTIAKVDFYQDMTLVGTATTAPYSFTWSGVAAGSYSLKAVATDDRGGTTTSASVSITVNANAAPTVSITSPGSGGTFTAPANITVTADAADSDGSVASVAFYYGTTLITTKDAAPYTFTWTGVPQGTYALTAVATDDRGATITSAPVSITVNQAAPLAQGYYIHVDHLNTPRLVADATGTAVWRWDQQEPFGVNVPDENPSGLGAFDLPLRLPGQYFDKETYLSHNYYRDYDSGIGRYVESDPIGLLGGLNTYGYVDGDPIGSADPDGLARGRSPKQTCTTAVRTRMQFQVGVFCKNAKSRCEDCDNCAVLNYKIHIKRSCIIAQRLLSKLCYSGDQTHKQRIEEMQNGIRRCMGFMSAINCISEFGDAPDMLPPSLDVME